MIALCWQINASLTGESVRGWGSRCNYAVKMQCGYCITDKQSHLNCALWSGAVITGLSPDNLAPLQMSLPHSELQMQGHNGFWTGSLVFRLSNAMFTEARGSNNLTEWWKYWILCFHWVKITPGTVFDKCLVLSTTESHHILLLCINCLLFSLGGLLKVINFKGVKPMRWMLKTLSSIQTFLPYLAIG